LINPPRAYDLTLNAVPRPHPLHQTPTHPRYATRQALLFLDVLIALVNPTGAATGSAPSAFSARACIGAGMSNTTAVCSAYTSVPPSHTPFSSPPAHGHCHTLSPSTPAPLVHHLHHHSPRAAHPHARVAPAAAVPHRPFGTDRHQAHHSVFRRILPSALGACAWAHPRPDLRQCPALARSAVPPRGRATRCLCAHCDVLGTLPL
jgi:hypothetical protein